MFFIGDAQPPRLFFGVQVSIFDKFQILLFKSSDKKVVEKRTSLN